MEIYGPNRKNRKTEPNWVNSVRFDFTKNSKKPNRTDRAHPSGREHALGSYVSPRTPRKKEGRGPLEHELGLLGRDHTLRSCPQGFREKRREADPLGGWAWTRVVGVLHLLTVYYVPIQAGRALNAHLIFYYVYQVTVAFWRGTTLKVDAANQVWQFGSDQSRYM